VEVATGLVEKKEWERSRKILIYAKIKDGQDAEV
jgi:hypothetical protein